MHYRVRSLQAPPSPVSSPSLRALRWTTRIDWVTMHDPGNAGDSQSENYCGSVAQIYQILRFEVINAQYV